MNQNSNEISTIHNPLESVWKNFTQLSIIVVIFGVIKSILFYHAFGIPAQYFLAISEITMLVSDNLVYITVLVIATFLFNDMVVHINNKSLKKYLNRNYSNKDRIQLAIGLHLKKYDNRLLCILYVISFSLPIVAIVVYNLYPNQENKLAIISSMIFALYMFMRFLFDDYIDIKLKSRSQRIGVLFIVLYSTFIVIITAIEVNQVKNGKYNDSIIYITPNDTIRTTNKLILIGKSDEYLFLYDKKKSKAIILRNSSVSKLELKRNSPNYMFFWYK